MSAVLDYRRKLYAIRDLPTLPAIAQKVLTLADDDDSGLEKLSAIITSDQSLSIRVLSMANSAYYGNRGKVGTIRHAVVVIGLNMLKQVALSALVCGTLGRRGKNRADFWKHSFGTAMAATTIANRTRLGDPDLCFMAGLLHDVGKLIIDAYFPNDPEMNHTEVGAWMAERWQLPQPLINAMAWHHSIEPTVAIASAPHQRHGMASLNRTGTPGGADCCVCPRSQRLRETRAHSKGGGRCPGGFDCALSDQC
jgi:putative nucleotidyltransferase with HDIG domain